MNSFFCQPKKKQWHFLWGSKPRGNLLRFDKTPNFCGSHFGAPGLAWLANIPHLPTWKRDFPAQIRRRCVDESIFSHLSITMAYIYIYIYTYIHKVPSWKLTYPIKGPRKLLSRWFSELPILVGYVIDRSLEGFWILNIIYVQYCSLRGKSGSSGRDVSVENPNRKTPVWNTGFQNPETRENHSLIRCAFDLWLHHRISRLEISASWGHYTHWTHLENLLQI